MYNISDIKLIVERIIPLCESGVSERWKKLPVKLSDSERYECIGGLLSRQATLAVEFLVATSIWNAHIAPVVLRSMVDLQITMSWILKDKNFHDRAKTYILYGLGQELLSIEHHRARADSDDEEVKNLIEAKELWLNGQRSEYLTEVNVGSFSGVTVREMAIDCELKDLYNFPYVAYSGAAHNMWHHVGKMNLHHCGNPLHNYHRVPSTQECPIDLMYPYRAVQYLTECFEIVDRFFSLEIEGELPRKVWEEMFNELADREAVDGKSILNGRLRQFLGWVAHHLQRIK